MIRLIDLLVEIDEKEKDIPYEINDVEQHNERSEDAATSLCVRDFGEDGDSAWNEESDAESSEDSF